MRVLAHPPPPLLEALLREMTPRERSLLTALHDDSVALPAGAAEVLRASNPRLRALRESYAALDLPVLSHSRWSEARVGREVDLARFRGESLFVWHYREWPRATELKFFVYAQYVRSRDTHGLFPKLGEDGAFGCWTFEYPGYGRISRDLIESVNELLFLDRQLGILSAQPLRVLDIGAGYGRLAHRMIQATPGVGDYCCVDAVPEATFVSEYYLAYRGCAPPARVVALTDLESGLQPASFDLAMNIHSFSECTYDAVAWWVEQLRRLAVPNLLIVPNHPTQLLTLELDGSTRDFRPLLEGAGYELATSEPVIDDAAVRAAVRLDDQFFLFRLSR